jgi:hypothetical protein
MEKFLLLIREDLKVLEKLDQAQVVEEIQEMTRWVESLAESGNFVAGEPLLTIGRYVSKNNVLTDGPFIEAKEAISGYVIIKGENLEQAISIAQTCPLILKDKIVIEVRPIMKIDENAVD